MFLKNRERFRYIFIQIELECFYGRRNNKGNNC